MVHRIHSRNANYNENTAKTLLMDQQALASTEGATALDMNATIEQNKIVEEQGQIDDVPVFENISIENATYLQNIENMPNNNESELKLEEEIPHFEVDSIELATPQLFSDDNKIDSLNYENKKEKDIGKFEGSNIKENSEVKEPEMFEKQDFEEDFEIPAFLRRQKN